MPTLETILLPLSLAGGGGLLMGAFIAWLLMQRRLSALHTNNIQLQTRLEAADDRARAREDAFQEARDRLTETFQSVSNEALRHNNEAFLNLAKQHLGQYQVQAKADLGEREKAVENLVNPIRQALERTEKQIRELEKDRQEAYGNLSRHLHTMAQAQNELRAETGNLVKALRRPEVRGRWGEMTLRRLVELAGMVDHCDFYEQEHVTTDSGALRPDMVVRMPNGRELVIDAKTPVDAYVDATEAKDDDARHQALQRHARGVRRQVQKLAEKAYWQQFSNTPDFVILFIPGEQFLSSALDADRDLLEYALGSQVILATPTSLVALLRAVAFGWRQEALAEHADQIREIGESLYGRLGVFTEHLTKIGKSLGSSVDHFNRAVGSLERQVLPAARRFTELGVTPNKPLETPPPVEKAVRSATSSDNH